MYFYFFTNEQDSTVNWSLFDNTNNTTPATFNAASTAYINILPIDGTRYLFVYRGDGSRPKAKIGTIDTNDNSFSYGDEVEMKSDSVQDVTAQLLDSTHAVVMIEDDVKVKALILEFSGTTITTIGTLVDFVSVNSFSASIAVLSSSEFLIAYIDLGVNEGVVYYGSVSGTTITVGNSLVFEPDDTINGTNGLAITKLNDTYSIIVAGHDGLEDAEAYLISMSGTTPVLDDKATIVDLFGVTVRGVSIARIDDNNAIAAYTEIGSNNNVQAVVITESSGSITVGTPVEVHSDSSETTSICVMDSTHALVASGINNDGIYASVIEIAGSSLTPLTSYEVIDGDKEYTIISPSINKEYALLAYEDDDDSSLGKLIVVNGTPATSPATAFKMQVKTDNAGTSTSTQFQVPTNSTGTYTNCSIWNTDTGTLIADNINTYNDAKWLIDFGSSGTYNIEIRGDVFTGFRFNNGGDKLKLIDITQCGILRVGNDNSYFYGCANLIGTGLGGLDVSTVANMASMFRGCTIFNQDIGGWDTGVVTNMANMFRGCTNFNQDLSAWDITSVTTGADFMEGANALSTTNYDAILIGWAAQTTPQNSVTIHFGDATYSAGAATTARGVLTSTYSWTITDGGAA